MAFGFSRSIFDKLQEELEERQRTFAIREQASSFQKWMRLGQPAPGMARAMNPVGAEYVADRQLDDDLRPSNFFQSILKRTEELAAEARKREQDELTQRFVRAPSTDITQFAPTFGGLEAAGLQEQGQFNAAEQFSLNQQNAFGQSVDDLNLAADAAQAGGIHPRDFFGLQPEQQMSLRQLDPLRAQAAAEVADPSLGQGAQQALQQLIPGAAPQPDQSLSSLLNPASFLPGALALAKPFIEPTLLHPNTIEAIEALRETQVAGPFSNAMADTFSLAGSPAGVLAATAFPAALASGELGSIVGGGASQALIGKTLPGQLIGGIGEGVFGPATARLAGRAVTEGVPALAQSALRSSDALLGPPRPVFALDEGVEPFRRVSRPGDVVDEVPLREGGRTADDLMSVRRGDDLSSLTDDEIEAGRVLAGQTDRPIPLEALEAERTLRQRQRGQGGFPLREGAAPISAVDEVAETAGGAPSPGTTEANRLRQDLLGEANTNSVDDAAAIFREAGQDSKADFLESVGETGRIRISEEAGEAVVTGAREAVGEGGPPRVDLPVGLTGGEGPVEKLRLLIRAAGPVREATEGLKSAELARRAARMNEIFGNSTGEEAFIKAQKAQSGDLPSADFSAPRPEFAQTEIDELFDIARTAIRLTPFQRGNAGRALFKALTGELPTDGEIALIGRVWGKELADELKKKRGFWKNFRENTLEAINLPRSIITAFDLSAPFRQGVLMAVGHPKEFFGNFPVMIKAFARKGVAEEVDTILKTGPKAQRRQSAKLFHAELDDLAALSEREEVFMSKFTSRIPFVNRSQRAYITFLNKLRADTFDNIVRGWDEGGGFTKADEKELADMINKFTGRGNLGPLNQYAGILSQTFFSSRLLASRVQIPLTVFSKSGAVRKQAARDILLFFGTGMSILTLAKLGGADVNLSDPRSANFGKIKIGNTRIDIWGGYLPLVKFATRVALGETTTSTGSVRDIERDKVVAQFLRSKLSPQAGLGTDVVLGKTFIGEELQPDAATFKTQSFNRLVPLFIQDMVDAINDSGLTGAALAGPAFFGVGVQTYETAAEAERDARQEVFDERQNRPRYRKYDTLQDLVASDDSLLAEIDKDERVVEAQGQRDFESEESARGEELVTEFKDGQGLNDRRLGSWFQAIADGDDPATEGMDPVTWGDRLSDHQQDLFSRRDEVFNRIEFPETEAPDGSVNQAVSDYFDIDLKNFEDPTTGERDWDAFFSAKDNALAPLGSDRARIQDWISRNFETGLVTAMRHLNDELGTIKRRDGKGYYDLDAGTPRTDFRAVNPRADAILWITGAGTTKLQGVNAAKEVQKELENMGVIGLTWQEVWRFAGKK